MKKLTWSFPMKVLAVFLLVLSALLAASFGVVIVAAYIMYFYRMPDTMDYASAVSRLMEEDIISEYGYKRMTGDSRALFSFIFNGRYSAIPLVIIGVICGIILFIYLMCAAGRRSGREGVTLGFFDKVPFDIVLVAAGFAELLMIFAQSELIFAWLNDDPLIWFLLAALVGVGMILVFLHVCYTFAARAKAGKWWRNTLVYLVVRMIFIWIRAIFRAIGRLFRAIRLEWRVALAVIAAFILTFFSYMLVDSHSDGAAFLIYLGVYITAFVVLVFSANQFRKLRQAGAKLAAGELDYTVDTGKMYFDFRLMGEDLNSIGGGMSAAVEQRMKSERLKTELITNVSHDIKTPLTSIINYVDLLQKEHTEEEGAQYLEVLKRQSEKLRRLTVDLVEASKASTGNLPTELVPTNSEELIHQAVAEYADRFAAGKLEPVITLPDKPITVLADGRHLWRVLDNLFGNAVKYAQPGTRVYIEARRLDGEAVISVKNISRDRLNVSSDELMERFVRGDESRHTEGSGLGLSIARSLTELMKGSFSISIDGDLFKAEIRLKVL